MSKHVIIYMPKVGEDSVQWAEADDNGKLASGIDYGSLAEAAAEVDGRRVTLILPADAVMLAEAVVPGGSLARAQQAVPYTLEEQLADDVDELHFALGKKGRDDCYPVAVIAHAMMASVMSQCEEAGLRPTRVVPEPVTIPQLESTSPEIRAWSGLLDGDMAIVRLDGCKGFATDKGMAVAMLQGAYAELPEDSEVSLVLFHTDQDAVFDVPEAIELELRPVEHRLALYASGLATSPLINLLQGVYSPRRNLDNSWKTWRWSVALVACLCAVLFVGKWLDVQRLAEQEASLDNQIRQAFESALPGSRMQRPRRQIQAALERLGTGGGEGFTHSLSQIAMSLATQPQTELRSIGYRNGRFDLDLNTDAVPTLDALKSELASRGSLQMNVQSANRENNSVRSRVRIE